MFEEELNEYWKTVVDTIQDGIMIVDAGGTIISVNKALEKISGFTTNEMIGKIYHYCGYLYRRSNLTRLGKRLVWSNEQALPFRFLS